MSTFGFQELTKYALDYKVEPSYETLTDEERARIAGAWLSEQSFADQIEAITESDGLEHFLLCAANMLQSPTEARQKMLIGAVHMLIETAARQPTEDLCESYAEEIELSRSREYHETLRDIEFAEAVAEDGDDYLQVQP